MSDALAVLAGLVCDTGVRWGAQAQPWQWADAEAVLEPGDGDPRLHWCGRPKGGSKSTDAAGWSISWLLEQAAPLAEGYVIASDHDQANRLLNKARGFVTRTPVLKGRVRVEAKRLVGPSGAYVEALPADEAGAQDLLTGWLVVDELGNWRDVPTARDMWTAAVSAVPKVPGARLAVLTFAGDPGHFAWKVRERARTSSAWRFVERPGPCPWARPEDLDEQRALLLPSQYVRRHENRWVAGEDRLTSRDDVVACVGHDGALEPEPGCRYVVSLDVGLVNDRTAAMVAHTERRDGKVVVVVDRCEAWRGSRDRPVSLEAVEAWVASVCKDYRAPLLFDPYQAQHLAERLRRRSVRAIEQRFNQTENGRRAVTLFRLLRDRLLDLPDDDGLVDELVAVRLLEPSPGVFRIDHDAGRHDDRAIALAMCAQHLVEHEPTGGAGSGTTSLGHIPMPGATQRPVALNPLADTWAFTKRELGRRR